MVVVNWRLSEEVKERTSIRTVCDVTDDEVSACKWYHLHFFLCTTAVPLFRHSDEWIYFIQTKETSTSTTTKHNVGFFRYAFKWSLRFSDTHLTNSLSKNRYIFETFRHKTFQNWINEGIWELTALAFSQPNSNCLTMLFIGLFFSRNHTLYTLIIFIQLHHRNHSINLIEFSDPTKTSRNL